jgi:septal ring factor EnvC (AmiA/AmiB activator)
VTSAREKFLTGFELAAKGGCVLALVVSLVTAVMRLTRNDALEVRIAARQEEAAHIARQVAVTRSQIEQNDLRVQTVIAAIRQEDDQKQLLTVEMGEILARVQMLKEQSNHFQMLRSDVLSHLQRMGDNYSRASGLAPRIQPP